MIDLLDIRYVRLGTRDLAAADRFAREVIGLERVRVEAGAHYYRSDERDHTLVYFEGDPRDHTRRLRAAPARRAGRGRGRARQPRAGRCRPAAPTRWSSAMCTD